MVGLDDLKVLFQPTDSHSMSTIRPFQPGKASWAGQAADWRQDWEVQHSGATFQGLLPSLVTPRPACGSVRVLGAVRLSSHAVAVWRVPLSECLSPYRPGAASGLVFSGKCCDETLLINVICGVVSGVISSALANPTDVLKIRMQAQGSLFQGGMIGSFIDIYQQEGTRGLWRGVVPTAQRAAIVVGVELPVYDITKKHLILSGLMGDTIFAHFVSSFTCGLAGAIASNPVDVVRTRMMNQRAIVGSTELYKGTLDGLVKTWKSEGFFALYKGFWPNWLRLGPWNIIFFITYEQLKRLPF
ncbi:brain mitochondrial carrier protein 1 isoform X4 [Cuculus canorus]|uniref:brain mitochondrial carrier protein 1 isoform X4 n=1 Tax=Cuculus canorus TaxID=55661 RepID=UPI0023AA8F30|nr:brain mitochondrial carrier protein 1 isoform X4 [Cuculus canorus]